MKIGTVLGGVFIIIAQENSFCLKVADLSNRYWLSKIPADFCYFQGVEIC